MKKITYPEISLAWGDTVHTRYPMAKIPPYPCNARTTAYHEAGHAVLCAILRVPMKSVELHTDGGGIVVFNLEKINSAADNIPPELDNNPMFNALLDKARYECAAMYVAGRIAELILHGIEWEGFIALDIPDWRNARYVLQEGFGHDQALYYCQRLAHWVLLENWAWVVALATEIETHGLVDGARVNDFRPKAIH